MQRTVARSRLRGALRIGGPLLVLFLLAGCLLPPQPVTDAGRDVFNLYIVVLVLAAIVFVAVEGFILYAIVRYRRKPGDETLPEQLHGNTLVEIIWTLIPTVIVFILFGFSMVTLGEVEARQDDPGVEIQVDGFQWQWTFRYENGASTTGGIGNPPTLAIPVDTPVHLILKSLDVNHAFYVPEFLLKRDLIRFADDSRNNELRFTVTEPGTYAGQCAEFCGLSHAYMRCPRASAGRPSSWPRSLASSSTPISSMPRPASPSASSSRTTTPRRTTSGSRTSASTARTCRPASRSRTPSRPWRPVTTRSSATSTRR